MAESTLFERTDTDRFAAVRLFITQEIKQRRHMLVRHPEQGEYWSGRVQQAESALADLEAMESGVKA